MVGANKVCMDMYLDVSTCLQSVILVTITVGYKTTMNDLFCHNCVTVLELFLISLAVVESFMMNVRVFKHFVIFCMQKQNTGVHLCEKYFMVTEQPNRCFEPLQKLTARLAL